MKKALLIFLIGVVAGAGGFWFFQQGKSRNRYAEAKDRITYTAWKVGKSLKEFTDEIKQELSRSGEIVREKTGAVGTAISGASVTAHLKGKYLLEPGLRSVSVDTTDSVVSLGGEVRTHEDIARAMKIALETDGVTKVVSKIQVSAAK